MRERRIILLRFPESSTRRVATVCAHTVTSPRTRLRVFSRPHVYTLSLTLKHTRAGGVCVDG